MLLPALAVDALPQLNSCVPALLTILGRVVCWKLRRPVSEPANTSSPQDTTTPQQISWTIREELKWQRLGM